MTSYEVLTNVSIAFLDTSVVIYYVELHVTYAPFVNTIFGYLDQGRLIGVTSPITLAECLVIPQRKGDTAGVKRLTALITGGRGIRFIPTSDIIGVTASVLRAKYNLHLPDALQLATAITAGCDVFVTNDRRLMRVTEMRVVVLDDLVKP